MLPSRYIQDWAYAPVIVILSDRYIFSAIDVGLNVGPIFAGKAGGNQ